MTPHGETMAIIRQVAEQHRVPALAILSRSRKQRIVIARYAAMRAVKQAKPHLSNPQIGAIFGRDHTIVCRALGWVSYSDPERARPLARLLDQLGGPLPK